MKMHLYQFENKLFLANNTKAVTEHVANYHQRDSYHIQQLPDDTLVTINHHVFDIDQVAFDYQKKAQDQGYAISECLSIYLHNATATLIDSILSPTKPPQHHQKITLSQTTPNFETITA